MHVGVFDLEHVKVIWGHSVHFSEKWAVAQKRLIGERKTKIWTSGLCRMHVSIFDLAPNDPK